MTVPSVIGSRPRRERVLRGDQVVGSNEPGRAGFVDDVMAGREIEHRPQVAPPTVVGREVLVVDTCGFQTCEFQALAGVVVDVIAFRWASGQTADRLVEADTGLGLDLGERGERLGCQLHPQFVVCLVADESGRVVVA